MKSVIFISLTFMVSACTVAAEKFKTKTELPTHHVKANFNLDSPIAEVDPRFLSTALDSHLLALDWANFNFTSRRVINMAKALAPGILRLGGTAGDLATFEGPSDNPEKKVNMHYCYCTTNTFDQQSCYNLTAAYNYGNFTLTKTDWTMVNDFARTSGLTFLFGLNIQKMTANHSKWDPTNAIELFKFNQQKGYEHIIWELGNEVNSGGSYTPDKKYLTGCRVGRDHKMLRRVLNDFDREAVIVGPDVNDLPAANDSHTTMKYLVDSVKCSGGAFDALTWHHYYMGGFDGTLEKFTSPDTWNSFEKTLNYIDKYLRMSNISIPLWLGETASGWGGGTYGLSNRYASGFLWLFKLGITAQHNYQVVIRQAFYRGCYALIGEDLYPYPDFWVSVLHKRLVGTKVFGINGYKGNKRVRLFAHCAKNKRGSVVVFGINVSKKVARIQLNKRLQRGDVHTYALNPKFENLYGREILLNGKELKLDDDENVPELNPFIRKDAKALFIKPYGMTFWVFPKADVEVCS